jgi:methyl-accepting chemotaxis protein
VNNLDQFRRLVAWALIVLGFVHVPVLIAVSWLRGGDALAMGLIALALAALPALLMTRQARGLIVGYALAVTLVGQTSLLVYAMSGHPWQVEMHFYYFAVLAMLSGFCGWRILILAAALIALHHLSLDILLPSAVYPGGTNFARVAVHAIVVVVETAMLIFIGHVIRTAFERAEASHLTAEASAAELTGILKERGKELLSTTERADQTGNLLARFEQEMALSVEALHKAASALHSNAEELGTAAARAGAQTNTVGENSEETARQVQLAAHAGDQLAQTIAEVGSNATESSQLAAAAVAEAERTNTTFEELAIVADEIGNVTGLINAIAGQTNLLALNATIEAARAGDAGRGFAIVAQEVKALAGQTAKATQEIAQRIEAMQNSTARSVSAITSISGTIRNLDRSQARIASAVEQQAESAREIASNVNAAANGVGRVGAAIGEIEAIVQKTNSAVAQLGSAAQDVASQTRTIRERVRAFTEDIQALRA